MPVHGQGPHPCICSEKGRLRARGSCCWLWPSTSVEVLQVLGETCPGCSVRYCSREIWGAAPGVFVPTAPPAATIPRCWVSYRAIPLPLLLRSATARVNLKGRRFRYYAAVDCPSTRAVGRNVLDFNRAVHCYIDISSYSASSRCHLLALGGDHYAVPLPLLKVAKYRWFGL